MTPTTVPEGLRPRTYTGSNSRHTHETSAVTKTGRGPDGPRDDRALQSDLRVGWESDGGSESEGFGRHPGHSGSAVLNIEGDLP